MSKSVKDLLCGIILKEVKDDFSCSYKKLTSLEGSPEKVEGYFDCFHNNLTSLKGCPKTVNEIFRCSYNKLTSLEGCPKEVKGDFKCSYNTKKFTKEEVKNLCNVKGEIDV